MSKGSSLHRLHEWPVVVTQIENQRVQLPSPAAKQKFRNVYMGYKVKHKASKRYLSAFKY